MVNNHLILKSLRESCLWSLSEEDAIIWNNTLLLERTIQGIIQYAEKELESLL